MKSIRELCRAIAMPEEVTAYVTALDGEFDWKTVSESLGKLLGPDTWKEGLGELRECLSEDPRGLKMLACMLKCCEKTSELYREYGIPEEIFVDTMGCFSRFVGEHKESFGCYGFDREWWTVRQLSGLLFRIGELEYEMAEKDGEKCLYLHIPSGSCLTRERVRDSLEQARAFFREKFPEFSDQNGAKVLCHSWLLSPTLKEVLSPGSHILEFQKFFDINVRGEDRDGEYKLWAFKRSDLPLEELPEDTSLQRNLKAYLLSGGKMLDADGVLMDF